jgi:predicted acyltransferase
METENAPTDEATPKAQRIASIDALRGFDMFWIIGGQGLVATLLLLFVNPLPESLIYQFSHIGWEGFSAWDLIMPLFLFVSGASMPFSFAKQIESGRSKKGMYFKLAKRILLLWVLGMIVQGNLLKFDLAALRTYSNTLQSIASGYLVAAVLLMHVSQKKQVIAAVALLLGYWLLLMCVPFGGHPAGTLEPGANLALHVDNLVLRSHSDGSSYTWVLSSLGFAATVLLGVFSGHILRSDKPQNTKALMLLGAGLGCLAAGWIWGIWFPIIKHIWTSSMVLWAGGWSYLLLAAFYWLIDVKGYQKWAFPFKVIGMNAIAVYVATHVFDAHDLGDSIVGHLVPRLGVFGAFLHEFCAITLVWLMLLYMYRKKTFIRV